ncbi:MAG TPA: Nif3-like dinuclear metal center hexameric protein, partial [Bryobacteraceae bacterium]|nr:Nif3-like dinuclear metal center hexameric protein [Bryobacteraceae bacterium]
PETNLNALALDVERKLQNKVLRVVGKPDLAVKQVAFLPGAAGSARQIQALERPGVEVLMIGETPEWETVEYVSDAVSQGRPKALLILGHIQSEQAGMEECVRWLHGFMSSIRIEFVAAREPFWLPMVNTQH